MSAPHPPPPRRAWQERALVFLLRLGGVLTGSAIFAVFLPTDWMDAVHRSIGLGPLPRAPLTDYLTRTISVLYAMHGAVLLVAASDVRRYAVLIEVLGWATLAFGALTVGIDLHAGLPRWWLLAEGPWVMAAAAAILWLRRGVR